LPNGSSHFKLGPPHIQSAPRYANFSLFNFISADQNVFDYAVENKESPREMVHLGFPRDQIRSFLPHNRSAVLKIIQKLNVRCISVYIEMAIVCGTKLLENRGRQQIGKANNRSVTSDMDRYFGKACLMVFLLKNESRRFDGPSLNVP